MNDTAIVPYGDVERMASAVAKSKLFGLSTPEQAIALMLVAQAEGRHPAIAARDYHIIQGRPALKADAILARFQEAGGRVEWTCYTHEKVEAIFSHAAGGSLRIAWTMEDAKRAGIGGKDTWRQYPRQMLRARVISEGVRTVYPAVLCGFSTPEEVSDFVPGSQVMPPVTVEPEPLPALAAAPVPQVDEDQEASWIAAIESAEDRSRMREIAAQLKEHQIKTKRIVDAWQARNKALAA